MVRHARIMAGLPEASANSPNPPPKYQIARRRQLPPAGRKTILLLRIQRYSDSMNTMQSDRTRSKIAAIKSDLVLLKWMTGFMLAMATATFLKPFVH